MIHKNKVSYTQAKRSIFGYIISEATKQQIRIILYSPAEMRKKRTWKITTKLGIRIL